MYCDEVNEYLALYLDNEIQGDERARFDQHIEECEACRAKLERERSFIQAVRNAGPLYSASPELRDQVANILDHPRVPKEIAKRSYGSKLNIGLIAAAILLVLALPVVVWRFVRHSDSTTSVRGTSSRFALMAADTHLRRIRGQLPLEIESESPHDISSWFSNKVNFSVALPNYQESSGQEKLYTLEGARLVGFKEDYAAYVAYRMKARPISLVITSVAVAKPSGGEEIDARGLKFHYDAIQGLKVITWSDRGLTYALVSDLEERGQQSCIVCHEGAKDRDFIEPLKPAHQ